MRSPTAACYARMRAGRAGAILLSCSMPTKKTGCENIVQSFYAHVDEILVEPKQKVRRGEQIATVGTANGKYWAHLHFEMREFTTPFVGPGYRDDTRGWIDPSAFIASHRGAPEDDIRSASRNFVDPPEPNTSLVKPPCGNSRCSNQERNESLFKGSSHRKRERSEGGNSRDGFARRDRISSARAPLVTLEKTARFVDLGCWLGSTSIALAQGHPRSQPSGRAIGKRRSSVLIDSSGRMWMPAHIPMRLYHPERVFSPRRGASVRDAARRPGRTNPSGPVSSYESKDGPIKILLVDAMKNGNPCVHRSRPPFFQISCWEALLIHQDFKHYYTSWIHVIQYRLRHHFRLDRSVPRSGTVAFEVIAPIPKGNLRSSNRLATIPDDEVDASLRHSLDLSDRTIA